MRTAPTRIESIVGENTDASCVEGPAATSDDPHPGADPSPPADPDDEVAAVQPGLAAHDRERRELQRQLRALESERDLFTAVVNHTDAGFLVIDANSRVVWTNRVFREVFDKAPPGRDPAQLQQTCHQAVCGKASPCDGCPVTAMFRAGKVCHQEFNRFLGDGFHHIYSTAVPIHDPQGKPTQAIVMLQDLSWLQVLRSSEEALRSAEQRYRSIFEQAGAGMVTTRADGSFLQVNPSFCTMLGYTESELLRMKLLEVIHFDEREAIVEQLSRVRSEGLRVIEMENRFLRRDLNEVWCHCTAVWQFKDGVPSYSVALIQDVSERKRAEIALEQSQKRYESLVHSIDGVVWEADPRAFRFSFVSKQAERILGYPVERWLSQPRFWRNQIHPADLERVLQGLSRVVEQKRGHEIEYRMIAANGGNVWIRDTVSLLADRRQPAKLRGLMLDITERKAAEEALRRSEEQLRQSQKMEAIGRLAGGIAHDFNNLLTAITGYGDLLLSKLGDHPLRREAAEIYKAAQRAADLTGQLLAFSRQQVLQPKVLDLSTVVADMELMLRRVIGEHIALITRHGSQVGAVEADPGQIHQVVLNLVVNARDAMPGGGTLSLETATVEIAPGDAGQVPGLEPGAYVTLTVSDTGGGMDEQTMSRLFEPFFTTKEHGKGTGLGLSTVYGIVKQSGGHVAVESALGQGSTFTIYLPRLERSVDVESRPAREAAADSVRGTERILLVEDDDSVRELAREILEMYGYSVVEAGDGVEALGVFESETETGTIDLMVTDLVMPQLGGRELAERIAPERPDLRVLFLSGYTDNVVLQQGLLDPGSFFLQKPFTPSELARKVREALDRG